MLAVPVAVGVTECKGENIFVVVGKFATHVYIVCVLLGKSKCIAYGTGAGTD